MPEAPQDHQQAPVPSPSNVPPSASGHSRVLWDDTATTYLIQARQEADREFRSSKRTKPVWERIAGILHSKGYHFNSHQCHIKWKNLLRDFRVTKTYNGAPENEPREMLAGSSYYAMMEQFVDLPTSEAEDPDPKLGLANGDTGRADDDLGVAVDRTTQLDAKAAPPPLTHVATHMSPVVGLNQGSTPDRVLSSLVRPIQPNALQSGSGSRQHVTASQHVLPRIAPSASSSATPLTRILPPANPPHDQQSSPIVVRQQHPISGGPSSSGSVGRQRKQAAVGSPALPPTFQRITVHTRKRSPFKENIVVTTDMTFRDVLDFAFPKGPPSHKRFVVRTALDRGNQFLPSQHVEKALGPREHMDIWVLVEDELDDYDDLF